MKVSEELLRVVRTRTFQECGRDDTLYAKFYPNKKVITENFTLIAINIFDDHDIIVCCQLILNLSIHPFICAFSIVSLAPLHINVGRLWFIRGRVHESAHLPGDRRGRVEVLHALPAPIRSRRDRGD